MMTAGIIGLGLIGGSLGLALNKYIPEIEIFGYDRKQEYLNYALEKEIISEVLTGDKYRQVGVIFIAVPVRAIVSVVEEIYSDLDKKRTVVTDMGSTKKYICREIFEKYPDLKFIGGHPLAGKEVSGPREAEADLFRNRRYILTPTEFPAESREDREKLITLLKGIGCKMEFMPPEKHDRLLSLSSHLPQVLANILMEEYLAFSNNYNDLEKVIASGFKDMTRLAASNPEMWVDIFMTNRENIVPRIEAFISLLEDFKDLVDSDREKEIRELMMRTRDKRRIMK